MSVGLAVARARHRAVFSTMGTMATLTLASTVDADDAARARLACEFSLATDEHRFSHYDERSEIMRWLNGHPIGDDALRDIRCVMDECLLLQIASDGVFSPFDPSTGRLDTAGYAKGHAIAKAVAAVRSVGIRDFSINVGGDTYCSGERAARRPWHIGIADPARRRRVAAVVRVENGAVATSGTSERGEHIWHRRPSATVLSFTVTGPEIATADAYATIGFAMGEQGIEWVAAHEGYSSLVIRADGRIISDAVGLIAG